jgi:hypothetical protein
MADQPRHPDTGADTRVAPDSGATASRPRWRNLFWIILVVALLAAMVVLHLTGVVGSSTNG